MIELTGSGKALGHRDRAAVHADAAVRRVRRRGGGSHPPRALLVTTAGLAALIAATLAVVTATRARHIWWVWGAGARARLRAGVRPARRRRRFSTSWSGPGDLPKAVGLYSITQSSARMLGPALGGAAYALLGSAACFAINGAVVPVRDPRAAADAAGELWPRHVETRDAGEQVREGLRYAWQHPELRAPLLANLLIGCLAFNFMTSIAAMIKFVFHADAAALGCRARAQCRRRGDRQPDARDDRPSRRAAHLAFTCFALALTILVNALAPGLTLFLLWAPIFGFSIGAYQTTLQSSVQRATAPAMLGRVSSLLVLGSVGTTPIGSLIVGWLIDAWSARAAMALGAWRA